jgi:nicotinamide mononucleotide transporter
MQDLWQEIIKGFVGMSRVEVAAVITSLLCVYLTVRNNIWNWFWGFLGVILYGWIFWQYKNYANCGLQILYFLPIQFVGWYVWKRGGPKKDNDLPITRLSGQARAGWLAATAVLTGVLYVVLRLTNDPLPFADGLTTAISITAQLLQVYKRFENWLLWIAADVIYALYVFPVQKLWASALLYVVFTVLAVIGARDWARLLRQHQQEGGVHPGQPAIEMPLP